MGDGLWELLIIPFLLKKLSEVTITKNRVLMFNTSTQVG